MRAFAIVLCAALVGCEAAAESDWNESSSKSSAAALSHPHPRLIALDSDLAATKSLIHDDPIAGRWFADLHDRAVKLIDAPPIRGVDGNMIHTARQALSRVTILSGIYRLTGEQRFGRRAIDEMLSVCRFDNWDVPFDLGTAEMTAAVGIGYDWTFDLMTDPERAAIRDAIIRKGLMHGIDAYHTNSGWTIARHNWNLVCNGGVIIGALAVMDEQPHVARQALDGARRSIRDGISAFAPDGGWEEGVTYWNYATRYLAMADASLQSAMGTDWDLLHAPGVARTGLFRIYTNGPANLPFNFADCEPVVGNSAQMEWFSLALGHPEHGLFEQQHSIADEGMLDLLWYRTADPSLLAKLPRDACFDGVNVASMRGDWTDPMTTFVAVKGGSNQAHHGHLDLGTFVLDALGQRWIAGLGEDDYQLPDYFGFRRWTYYRCATRGQNTITLDNRNQELAAHAPITAFGSGASRSHAVLNLDEGYASYSAHVRRGVALLDRRQVLVQDELDLLMSADVRSTFHTTAEVVLNGSVAHLHQGGQTLTAQILSPLGARFEVASANPPPPEQQTPGLKKLIIELPQIRGHATIAVLFSPGESQPQHMDLTPLSSWNHR